MKAFLEAGKVRLEHPTTDCGAYIYPRRLRLDEARRLRDELTRVLGADKVLQFSREESDESARVIAGARKRLLGNKP